MGKEESRSNSEVNYRCREALMEDLRNPKIVEGSLEGMALIDNIRLETYFITANENWEDPQTPKERTARDLIITTLTRIDDRNGSLPGYHKASVKYRTMIVGATNEINTEWSIRHGRGEEVSDDLRSYQLSEGLRFLDEAAQVIHDKTS